MFLVDAISFKRLVDFIGSLVGLLFLSVPLVLVAVAVRRSLGSPVVFSQVRSGLQGRPFTLYKFRTMRDAVGCDGAQLPDGERLTDFGRWLRETSLDELPTLWNVLKGDMSLVGPRPLLMDYIPLYSARQIRRHDVRPGVTGWAQVNGRNALSWEEKFELDVWYVEHWSIWLDIKILFLTIRSVVRRSGINAPNSVTMPRFTGSIGD
jgi:lipopolysaccharide/colanic/teichoic acid biosynthesis glycosyltransferase